ncbi:MAG: transcriptional regulator, MarR family [Deltaproteobacteria bacterium]|nr:transcriptional regulator, MarR family [Deltaproteobacteria bacterium]
MSAPEHQLAMRNDPDEPIGLLIGALRRRIKQAVGSCVRAYGLSVQQFWVLVAISEMPGLSLGELAMHLRMDKPTASRVVFTLMRRKLLDVKGDAADRRRARLYLGSGGARLAKELQQHATAVRSAVTRGLSVAEQDALRKSLRKIIGNMDRFQEQQSRPPGQHANPPVVVAQRSRLRRPLQPG